MESAFFVILVISSFQARILHLSIYGGVSIKTSHKQAESYHFAWTIFRMELHISFVYWVRQELLFSFYLLLLDVNLKYNLHNIFQLRIMVESNNIFDNSLSALTDLSTGDRYGYHYDEETGDQGSKEWFNKNLFVAAREVIFPRFLDFLINFCTYVNPCELCWHSVLFFCLCLAHSPQKQASVITATWDRA